MMQSPSPCEEFELLMQADIDGELDAAQVAAVTAHRNQCMRCMVHYKELMSLRERVRDVGGYVNAGDQFRSRLLATLRAAEQASQVRPPAVVTPPPRRAPEVKPVPAPSPPVRPVPRPWYLQAWMRDIGAFAAGGLLVSCLLLPWLGVNRLSPTATNDELIASHIRSLQASHLLDVASNDQHNVKPWFEGRIDYAPPVKNLAAQGFPLAGGRLEYMHRQTVAVLVYQHGKHPINMFIWPDSSPNSAPVYSVEAGYNLAHWTQAGMSLWVVTDMNPVELKQFTDFWLAQ